MTEEEGEEVLLIARERKMRDEGGERNTCLQNELAKSVNENSCMLHDQTVFFIVGSGVPSQLNYLPQQGNLAPGG